MIKLSICIPTFNRVHYLKNCLNSIYTASKNSSLKYEVCISDNYSEEKVSTVIEEYKDKINIVFNQNKKNIGLGGNILKSVSFASGDFAWILGNDDLVLPNTFSHLEHLFKNNSDVDFYYINSYHLEKKSIEKYKHPFETKKFNFENLKKFSNYNKSGKQNFFELINPKKSFEFMLSMYLCIFRLKYWKNNTNIIDAIKIMDTNLYSNFDNTAPHIKIWAKAFCNKKAYFLHKPQTANIHGPRNEDWGDLYPFVEAVRIPQVLDCYKKNGMSFVRFFICKNFALRRFLPSYFNMITNSKFRGLEFVDIRKDVFNNLLYPGIYLFGLYYFFRRLIFMVKKLF